MATAGTGLAVAADAGGWPKRSVAMTATRVLLALVFCGWMMMWVVMPTNTYRQGWQPKIREDTNSTYFGTQGANLLVFTFPIMFIAVVGCVYLHYEHKWNASDRSSKSSTISGISRRLEAWKRPFLMKGPLGIVSYTETAIFAMFIVLLVWCFSCWLQISFSTINDAAAAKAGEAVWEMRMESAGLRLGLVGNICLAFLFFPVTRGSSLLPLVGLTSESSVRYHIWVGHIAMALFTGHGVCYFIYWAATGNLSEMLKWDKIGVSNVAGELALLCGLALWVTTLPNIRRKMFELFFYTHQLYTLFILFFFLHVPISFFCYILPGVYLFMVDRYLRFLQSRQRVRLVSARLLPGETMELNFAKIPGFQYTTTSVVFINVPGLSKLQWHPFTVSSSSGLEPEKLSVIIKKEGRWTQKLYQMLDSPTQERLDVSIEGPYGPISNHFLKYDSLFLVSGGSGITPFISIIRELIFRATTLNCDIPNVRLICAFKTSVDLNMLDLILPASGDTSNISCLRLHVEAFVTREREPTFEAKKHLRTIWFKPSVSDLPLSPVLGPNNWLWLGVVISSSFIAFLLLLGILTRYYIYPIDKNTNKVYSYSAKVLLNLLFVCVCIVGAAGIAFLWNKRRTMSETNQVRITNAPSPLASPGSLFHNADQELESLPSESLVQVTKVHYGARPDLKKILLECEEPNTGVFVSGPASMRREVAAVCGSGLVDNMNFEALSFTW